MADDQPDNKVFERRMGTFFPPSFLLPQLPAQSSTLSHGAAGSHFCLQSDLAFSAIFK